jgi:type IV pilus assembly protein PilV
MVAILLFAVGVLAVAGLQASMVKNTTDSKSRVEASYYAQRVIGQMWADPVSTKANLFNGISPIDELPNGSLEVSQQNPGDPYLIVVRWQQPGQDPHNFSTLATID